MCAARTPSSDADGRAGRRPGGRQRLPATAIGNPSVTGPCHRGNSNGVPAARRRSLTSRSKTSFEAAQRPASWAVPPSILSIPHDRPPAGAAPSARTPRRRSPTPSERPHTPVGKVVRAIPATVGYELFAGSSISNLPDLVRIGGRVETQESAGKARAEDARRFARALLPPPCRWVALAVLAPRSSAGASAGPTIAALADELGRVWAPRRDRRCRAASARRGARDHFRGARDDQPGPAMDLLPAVAGRPAEDDDVATLRDTALPRGAGAARDHRPDQRTVVGGPAPRCCPFSYSLS